MLIIYVSLHVVEKDRRLMLEANDECFDRGWVSDHTYKYRGTGTTEERIATRHI